MISGEVHPAFFKAHLLDPLGCKDTDPGGTSGGALTTSMDLPKLHKCCSTVWLLCNMRFMSPESVRLMAPQEGGTVSVPTRIFAWGIGTKIYDSDHFIASTIGHAAPMGLSSISIPNEIWLVTMTRTEEGKDYLDTRAPFVESYFDAWRSSGEG